MKFKCLSLENFLTSVTNSVPEEVVINDDTPHLFFSQKELHYLVRDLRLSNSSAELLTSTLKKRITSLTVLACPCTATDIKIHYVLSLKRRTEWTVQIFLRFCTSLECNSMNPNIGWCSSTAASDLWNVFCSQRQVVCFCIPWSPDLPKENYETVKHVLEKIGYDQHEWLILLSWRRWIFCWDSSPASPSIHAFSTWAIVGTLHYPKKD